MPDDETQALYDELNRRGVFSSDADAQAIGHELRRRGVVSDATQGGLVKPTPSQASTSKPFSPTSGNTLPPPSQAQLQKQFASSKASNAPITMQTLPMQGKPSGKATPMASPEATAAFNKQYQDQLAGNAFYTKSQLDALPNDFTGWLKRTLSGMVTPENMLIGAALPMAPALGPLGVAAEKTAGVYFGAQGVAQGIKVGQKYGLGAGLGAALPFIAPAAIGKTGEIINKRGLPAPPEAQSAAPVQPGRPIAPTEPGTSRPPFVGTPTPAKAVAAPDAIRTEPSSSTNSVPSVPTSVDDSISRLRANNGGYKAGAKPEIAAAELMSAGKLSYSPDKGIWSLGPYTGKTAKYVVDAYAKNGGDIRPIGDRLAAHSKDVENLKAQYGALGKTLPETGAMSRLAALQAERDSLYQPQPTPEAAATAKAPDTQAPPLVPPTSPQQTAGSPVGRAAGEPLSIPAKPAPWHPFDISDVQRLGNLPEKQILAEPGFKYSTGGSSTHIAQRTVDGKIELRPSYFELPVDQRAAVLRHEMLHGLEDNYNADPEWHQIYKSEANKRWSRPDDALLRLVEDTIQDPEWTKSKYPQSYQFITNKVLKDYPDLASSLKPTYNKPVIAEPLPPESAAAIERIKAGQAAKQTSAHVEPQPLSPASTPASGLGDLGKMASGISDNMHAALWKKIQSGDTTEGGKPSGMLQAAAKIRSAGGLQTPEDAKSFATAWGTEVSGKTGDEFQQSAKSVASRFLPQGEPTNVQPEAVGRNNEAVQRGTADTVVPGKAAAAAETKTGTPEAVNPSKRILKMSEQEAVADALHLSLPERKSMSEKQGDVIDAAMANYHDILSTLKNYDPAEHETLTRAERVVAAVHQGDLADRLTKLLGEADKNPADKTKQAQIDAVTAELSHVGNMIYRSGSEAGRNLAFQKAILPDPTSAAAVLQRADTLTLGKVSPLVRQTLLRKVEAAQNLKADLDIKTEAKAVEAEKQVRQGTNQAAKGIPKFGEKNTVFTSDRAEAARVRLKEKMGRASAGFDPTALADIVEIGGYYFEGGVRKFADWADKIRTDAPGIDDESLRKAWTQVVSNPDIKGRKPVTVADVKARAEKTLSGLGKAPKAKPDQPQIDIATAEYAKGANSLNAFARSVEKRFGQKMEPQEIQTLFTEAAKKYRADYKQLDAIKGDMAKVIAKAAYNNRPGWQKLGININEAANVGRTLITSYDMSGLLRQGGFLAQANPRAAIPAVRDMFAAARSEEGANAIDAEIRSRKNAEDYDKSKLFLSEVGEAAPKLSDREEGFVSNIAGKIPGVQASERAYSTVLNRLRADTYDRLTNDLERRGTKATDEEKAQIANFINKASGRGSLGEAGNAAGVLLSKVFFSPRYLASRVQMLAGEPIIAASGHIIKSGSTRQLVAREYARYMITVGTIIGLSAAGGANVETDPRSSDFLTLRFGKVEVDPLSGFKQVAVFLTRMITGQSKLQNGTIADLSNPKTPLSPTRISTIERFGRSKLAPAFGAAYDLMDRDKKQAAAQKYVIGKDFIGRPVTPASMLRNNILPIGVNNVYEGLRDQGMTPQNARDLMSSFALDTFGMGSNVRDRKQEAREINAGKGSGVSYKSPKF